MNDRQDAKAFLQQFCSCMPKHFYSSLDARQRGLEYILGYLRRAEEEVNPGELARRLNVSTARIAALLNKLEGKGWIERCAAAEDGRRTVVKLTPAGAAYVEEKEEHLIEVTEMLIKKVGKEDLEEYIRILKKIAAALEG